MLRRGSTGNTVAACAVLAAAGGACAQTVVPFTEESEARGLARPVFEQTGQYGAFGRGLAFADLDGDGDADLVTTGHARGLIGLYENDGTGRFIDHNPLGTRLPLALGAAGVTAADYDADGDLDLHISCWIERDLLLRNDGGFAFTNVAADARVADDGPATGASWGDYDGDGWLDLYVPNRTESMLANLTPSAHPNRLFRNNGDGTFSDVASPRGIGGDEDRTLQGAFLDIDRDADQDLYVANEKGYTNCSRWTNRLFRNDGGVFTDVSVASRTAECMDGMCVAVGDFDGNQYDDIYVTDTIRNRLLLNQGDGSFVESSIRTGTGVYVLGWGAVFLNFDNSGSQDLYVCNESARSNLFVGEETGTAVDIASSAHVDDGRRSVCVASADVDGDGDMDLAVSNIFDRVRLYINHEGERRHWIQFDVRGREPNLFAIGARVDIRTGSAWQTRQIIAGSNYKSQNDLAVHFGLGDATVVDEAIVTWLGGESRRWTNLTAGQRLTLTPGCLCDWDGDGDLDIFDLLGYLDDWFQGVPAADATADGLVDLLDVRAFVDCWFGASGCG